MYKIKRVRTQDARLVMEGNEGTNLSAWWRPWSRGAHLKGVIGKK